MLIKKIECDSKRLVEINQNSVDFQDVGRKGRMVIKLTRMAVLVAEKGKVRSILIGGKGDKDKLTLR